MRSNQNPFMVNKSYIMCIFCIIKVTSIVNTVPNTVFKLKSTYWICLFPESIYVVTLTNRIQNPGAVFNTQKKEEKKRTRKDRGSPRLFLLKADFLEQSSLPDIALLQSYNMNTFTLIATLLFCRLSEYCSLITLTWNKHLHVHSKKFLFFVYRKLTVCHLCLFQAGYLRQFLRLLRSSLVKKSRCSAPTFLHIVV